MAKSLYSDLRNEAGKTSQEETLGENKVTRGSKNLTVFITPYDWGGCQ